MARVAFETRTIMTVPHKSRKVSFDSHVFGPTTYKRLREDIDEEGLLMPTFSEIVSLAYAASMNKNVYAERIMDLLKNRGRALCSFDRVVPENGVFLLSDRDREVEFPAEFKTEEQTFEEFAENPRIKALCAEGKTTKRLANLARKLNLTPYVSRINPIYEKIDVSTLSIKDGRLMISANNFDFYDELCSFGVLKVTGAKKRK